MAPFDNNNIINTDYFKSFNGLQRSESADCQPLPYYIHRNGSHEDNSDMKRTQNSPNNYYSEYHHHQQHQQFSQSTYPPHDYGSSTGYHHHHHHHSFNNTDDENEDHGSTASTPQRSNQSSKTLTGAWAYGNNKNSHNSTWGSQNDNPFFYYPRNYGMPHSGSHQVERYSNSVSSREFSGHSNNWKSIQRSAGERLYQYRPESSSSQYFLDGRSSNFSGWQQSEGFGTSEVYSYYTPTTAREDHIRFNLASVDGGDDPDVSPIPVPPTTPHSALRARVPNKVTPSSGEPIRRKGGDSDEDSMKSLAPPSSTDSHRPKESDNSATTRDTSKYVTLRDLDIVVGRGAPTNYHIGNAHFQDLVAEYRVSYFCAKRSDKPQIAMEIMDVLKERGSRFVRREKGGRQVGASWMVVSNKLAYEKVCAALRDGAPQVQNHLMSSSQKIRETLLNQHQEEQKQKGAMEYSEGDFTDILGDLEKENGHNLKQDAFQK